MAEQQIADALARILERLDALESKVDALATAGDMPAEAEPTEMSVPAGPGLTARLEDPAVAAGLSRLLDRLDRIEAAVDTFGHLAVRLPVLMDVVASSANHAFDELGSRGLDPLASYHDGLDLVAKAGSPASMALAEKLLDQGPTLERVLAHADTLEVLVSALDHVRADDLRVVLTEGSTLLPKLASVMRSPEFQKLADSLDTGIGVASQTSAALVETTGQPVTPVGAFGAFFKMGDPDIQKAVGFSLAVAKAFGQRLD